MTRETLLNNAGYHIMEWQLKLYDICKRYSIEKLSSILEIPEDEAKLLIDGDWDGSISKYIEYCIKLGYMPKLNISENFDKEYSVVVQLMTKDKTGRDTITEYSHNPIIINCLNKDDQQNIINKINNFVESII